MPGQGGAGPCEFRSQGHRTCRAFGARRYRIRKCHVYYRRRPLGERSCRVNSETIGRFFVLVRIMRLSQSETKSPRQNMLRTASIVALLLAIGGCTFWHNFSTFFNTLYLAKQHLALYEESQRTIV